MFLLIFLHYRTSCFFCKILLSRLQRFLFTTSSYPGWRFASRTLPWANILEAFSLITARINSNDTQAVGLQDASPGQVSAANGALGLLQSPDLSAEGAREKRYTPSTLSTSSQMVYHARMNDDFDDLPEKPSKSQRKREVEALQALGEALLSFAPAKLTAINLPPELMAALVEAHRISARRAGRRQNQYIGRLMRDLDEETLAAIKHFLSVRGR